MQRDDVNRDLLSAGEDLHQNFRRKRKEEITLPYAESLTLADEDININWESYKERFLKGGFP